MYILQLVITILLKQKLPRYLLSFIPLFLSVSVSPILSVLLSLIFYPHPSCLFRYLLYFPLTHLVGFVISYIYSSTYRVCCVIPYIFPPPILSVSLSLIFSPHPSCLFRYLLYFSSIRLVCLVISYIFPPPFLSVSLSLIFFLHPSCLFRFLLYFPLTHLVGFVISYIFPPPILPVSLSLIFFLHPSCLFSYL